MQTLLKINSLPNSLQSPGCMPSTSLLESGLLSLANHLLGMKCNVKIQLGGQSLLKTLAKLRSKFRFLSDTIDNGIL